MKGLLQTLILSVILCCLGACTSPDPEGLWKITEVRVGEQTMTPLGRWIRLNADGTQQSGNGWLQHSTGSWRFSADSALLSMHNDNGLDDPFGPFLVELGDSSMLWTRVEEGDTVRVALFRTAELPAKPADQLYGLWGLESSTLAGTDLIKTLGPGEQQYLFLRWDQRFVLRNGEGKRKTGVYIPHGHRRQLSLIFDDQQLDRQLWSYEVEGSGMVLSTMVDDEIYTDRYRRIRAFPD